MGILRDHNIRVKLSPDILLNRHLALMAQTGGGKSYTAGVIMEELLLRRYPVVVIDVANEYGRMLYPNAKMKKYDKFHRYPRGFPDRIDFITKWTDDCYKLIKRGRMLIINIKNIQESDQPAMVRDICDDLFDWRSRQKSLIPPTFLVIEETHKFAPQQHEICSSSSVYRVLSEGRKYQLGCCIITQRPAKLHKNALSQCWTQILHKVTNRNDLQSLEESAERAPPNFTELLQTLSQGEALVIGGGLNFTAVVEIRERMSDAK
jgi:DNA helicase HerA-like ATPase